MDLQLWKRETGGFSMEEMWVGGDKCGEEIAMDIIWLSAEEWYRMERIRWVLQRKEIGIKRDYLKRFCSVEGGIDYHFHKHLHS